MAPFCRPDRVRGQTRKGQVAQSVEQRTENPCVGGSIPPLATTNHKRPTFLGWPFRLRPPSKPRVVQRSSACAGRSSIVNQSLKIPQVD